MLYAYTAKNEKGETYTAEFEAPGRNELYEKVRKEGGRIVSVKEKGSSKIKFSLAGSFGGVSAHDKIIFAKNLSSMLSAGLSITRALDVMGKQTRKRALSTLIHDLSVDVSRGEALSVALSRRSKVFPPLFVSMVRAGEEAGNLSDSLRIVGLQMEKAYQLSKRVKGAMIYPAVVFSLMIVLSILLLIYMVPTLTATFEGLAIDLPLSTRIIIAASDFLVKHTLLVVALILAAVLLIAAFVKSRIGRRLTDSVIIRLPVIGLIAKEVESARTARTLSSLLSAGVPIVTALDVTEAVLGNHLYKKAIAEAKSAIQKGETISMVLGRYENIYPSFVSEMAAVGEETGKISEMLQNAAIFYEDDVDEKTKDLSTIVEPLLMVFIGAGVGIFAISMLAPTYSLVEKI